MANTVDYLARAEELARHLAANFDRRTLAMFIARDALTPALREAYGNPAMREVSGFVAGVIAEFAAEQRVEAAEAKRQAKVAAAEALFTTPASGLTGDRKAIAGGERRPTLTLRPASQ